MPRINTRASESARAHARAHTHSGSFRTAPSSPTVPPPPLDPPPPHPPHRPSPQALPPRPGPRLPHEAGTTMALRALRTPELHPPPQPRLAGKSRPFLVARPRRGRRPCRPPRPPAGTLRGEAGHRLRRRRAACVLNSPLRRRRRRRRRRRPLYPRHKPAEMQRQLEVIAVGRGGRRKGAAAGGSGRAVRLPGRPGTSRWTSCGGVPTRDGAWMGGNERVSTAAHWLG